MHNEPLTDLLSTVYDYLNVALIHNTTIASSSLLDPTTVLQLRTLADQHEWNLAYNVTNPARAVAGMVLAGQIVQALNATLTDTSKPKLSVQFGTYASFASFFGLAGLQYANPDFYGCLLYTSPSPRDRTRSRMPSSA